MLNFYNTKGGRQFIDQTVPQLVKELHALQEQLKIQNESLIQHLETTAVEINDDSKIAKTINDYSVHGWRFKDRIPEHVDARNQVVDSVLIFERAKRVEGSDY